MLVASDSTREWIVDEKGFPVGRDSLPIIALRCKLEEYMDIDRRLEALTQTVELSASFQKEMFQRMDERDARAEARMVRLENVLAAVGSTVLEHEDRIAGLEKRLA